MSESHGQGLFARTARALVWSYGVVIVRTVTSLAFGIILARILGPEPFGIVAAAGIVIGLSSLVSDFGFGAALVQAQAVTEEDVRFVFTWQMVVAIGLSVVVIGLSGPAARLFALPEAQAVIASLASLFVINAIGQTSTNLLKRRMAFKQLQLTLAASVIIGYGLFGVPAALYGLGVWSLVIAQISQGFLLNVATYSLTRHSLRPKFTIGNQAARFLRFGSNVVIANVANWAIDNLPKAFISRAFGATDLGLYSRSATLMTAPTSVIVTNLQAVLFPAYSRAQARLPDLRRVYTGTLNALAIALLPPFAGIAATSGTLVEVVLGTSWRGAAPIVIPLAIAMPLNALMAMAGPLIYGIGKVGIETRLQVTSAIAMSAMLAVASGISVQAVSWGVLGVASIRLVLLTRAAARALGAQLQEILSLLIGPAATAISVGLAALVADRTAHYVGLGPHLALLLSIVLGLLFAVGGCVLAARSIIGPDLRWLVARSGLPLPLALQRIVSVDREGNLQ